MDWDGDGGHLTAILEFGSSEEEEEDEEASGQQCPSIDPDPGDAEARLAELEQASQALLAELAALDTEVELEQLSRERAEAFTARVKQENTRLKRLSLAPTPEGTREVVTPKGTPEEVTSEEEPGPARRSGQQLPDPQDEVSRLLEQIQQLQRHNQHLQTQLELEQEERQRLRAALASSQRALRSFKRVSQIVAQDYCQALEQLELEQDLRCHAEAFAHEMLVRQKEANRQSSILLRSAGPDGRVLEALQELGRLSRELEETRREQQQRVKELEEQLELRPQPEELDRARAALAEAEEEKVELRKRLREAEKRLEGLQEEVGSLREERAQSRIPEPPPPPPPLPPPGPAVPADPLAALRQKKALKNREKSGPDGGDVRARAVQEMMERIRSGVVLRPAGHRAPQDAVASKRRSAALELQGILGAMRRPSRRRSGKSRSSRKIRDEQLESILQRRRRAVDASVGVPTGNNCTENSRGASSPAAQQRDGAPRPEPANAEGSDTVPFRPRGVGGLPRTRPLGNPGNPG